MNKRAITTTSLALFLVVLIGSQSVFAQEDFDPRKAILEIKEDMKRLKEDFSKLQDTDNSAIAEDVVENIDKLLEGMQSSQDRVMKNIDDLIKNQKSSNSSSSSSSSGQKPKKGDQGKNDKPTSQDSKGKGEGEQKRHDNNKSPEEQQRDEAKGEKPGNEPKDPQAGQDEKKPEQTQQGVKPSDSGTEKVAVIEDAKVWGRLPPEVRQLLIERNYRDYFPNYEKEIADYLKSLNKKR